jgi:hypothetical protein
MSDERTYIMIKYVHHVSDDDEDEDEDDVFTRLSLSLSKHGAPTDDGPVDDDLID